MAVYDRTGAKIGTVEHVYLGPAAGHAGERALIDDLAAAMAPTGAVSEASRQRLLRRGFMRIDSARLFAAARYALPEQIASVVGDGVILHVMRGALIKARRPRRPDVERRCASAARGWGPR
jgi:hypothetical protein